ncbi:MAG: ABC transporter permease subunit [Gammaproteobacteria bacterium]|nr:ABC transporter permease subunit [Gammaproteobacteria bacterium]
MSPDSDTNDLTLPKPLEFNLLLWRRRSIRDFLARYMVGVGGIAVIGSIILIFVFLFAVVFPLFKGAQMHPITSYSLSQREAGDTLMYSTEEQAEISMRLDSNGVVHFFFVDTGTTVQKVDLLAGFNARVSSWAHVNADQNIIGLGLDTGQILIFRHSYVLKYGDNRRTIVPRITYPYGEEPLDLEIGNRGVINFAAGDNEEGLTIFAHTEDGSNLIDFKKNSSFMDEDEMELELASRVELPYIRTPIRALLSPERQWLYLLSQDGVIAIYDIRSRDRPAHVEDVSPLEEGRTPASFEFLVGGISVLFGDDRGNIYQLFPVRDEAGMQHLTKIRQFNSGSSKISGITSEQLRKGFLVTDEAGNVSIFHTTASRHLLTEGITDRPLLHLSIAPRSNKILAEDNTGALHVWKLDSEHPEASFSSIWGKVWYESYPEPDFVWQSSSASSDFEPKFSLTPLTFGTFKAAFYAMLLAMPLAICGAIFTAYFMAPQMRGVVKPTIEIMEALPTVILGFLAGLWLAPYVEAHLPGIFICLLAIPGGMFLASLIWWHVPESVKMLIPDGWQAALLVPVVLICGWLALAMSPWMENTLFDGNMRIWITNTLGIGYDQRNSIIIGIAMGFAVIPTIFSIAEDAVFSVPRHLTAGSLALGATPWQSLVRVVLPSASPGIFSATMIGLGRAVGETMIVLMATGNTPVMDFSIFEGMRTLSANVAVELPESEVDSTHFRILFLAALVLFIFTFFFNTIAEIVRQRLREKYSTL